LHDIKKKTLELIGVYHTNVIVQHIGGNNSNIIFEQQISDVKEKQRNIQAMVKYSPIFLNTSEICNPKNVKGFKK